MKRVSTALVATVFLKVVDTAGLETITKAWIRVPRDQGH